MAEKTLTAPADPLEELGRMVFVNSNLYCAGMITDAEWESNVELIVSGKISAEDWDAKVKKILEESWE